MKARRTKAVKAKAESAAVAFKAECALDREIRKRREQVNQDNAQYAKAAGVPVNELWTVFI